MKALSLIATVAALLIRPPQIPAAESSQERTTELLARIPCLEFIVDPSRPRRVLMSCDEYVLSHFTAADSLNLLDIVRDPAKKQLWDNAFYAIGMLALGGKTQITPGDLIAAVEAVEKIQRKGILYAAYVAIARTGGKEATQFLLGRLKEYQEKSTGSKESGSDDDLAEKVILALGFLEPAEASAHLTRVRPSLRHTGQLRSHESALENAKDEIARRAEIREFMAKQRSGPKNAPQRPLLGSPIRHRQIYAGASSGSRRRLPASPPAAARNFARSSFRSRIHGPM